MSHILDFTMIAQSVRCPLLSRNRRFQTLQTTGHTVCEINNTFIFISVCAWMHWIAIALPSVYLLKYNPSISSAWSVGHLKAFSPRSFSWTRTPPNANWHILQQCIAKCHWLPPPPEQSYFVYTVSLTEMWSPHFIFQLFKLRSPNQIFLSTLISFYANKMWAILWIYLWMIWTSVIIDVMWFPLLADLTISDYYFSLGEV